MVRGAEVKQGFTFVKIQNGLRNLWARVVNWGQMVQNLWSSMSKRGYMLWILWWSVVKRDEVDEISMFFEYDSERNIANFNENSVELDVVSCVLPPLMNELRWNVWCTLLRNMWEVRSCDEISEAGSWKQMMEGQIWDVRWWNGIKTEMVCGKKWCVEVKFERTMGEMWGASVLSPQSDDENMW